MRFFELQGVAINAADQRNLSPEEIDRTRGAYIYAQQQAANRNDWAYIGSLMQASFGSRVEMPLDVRFLEFKVRLAAAIAKYPALSTTTPTSPST